MGIIDKYDQDTIIYCTYMLIIILKGHISSYFFEQKKKKKIILIDQMSLLPIEYIGGRPIMIMR